jgi:hypothetical protein
VALRWRAGGELLCAAKTEPEEGDTYIDDRLHYQLSVVGRVIIADVEETTNGRWHWVHDAPFLRAVEEMEMLRGTGALDA